MTKEILKQYTDLQQECAEVREKISILELQIIKIEQEGTVLDKVSGGVGGLETFVIEGFPIQNITEKKRCFIQGKRHYANLN